MSTVGRVKFVQLYAKPTKECASGFSIAIINRVTAQGGLYILIYRKPFVFFKTNCKV